MIIAADDTDSMRGNCTTFLATEIINAMVNEGWDLIGYPRLVRLNPAIPWKTRGNGALVMEFGKGIGKKELIGKIENKDIFFYYEKSKEEPEIDFVKKLIFPIVEKFHDPDYSDPGILMTFTRPDYSFYKRGVTRVMPREDVENEIIRIGASKMEWGIGRGIIGCVCGSAWIPEDRTFELLAYRCPDKWGTKREYDPKTIAEAEKTIVSSFNSFDFRHGNVAMVPATPCPVMYGFRGDIPEDLIKGHDLIKTEKQYRWLIFETNQGTDDHIIPDPTPEEFIPDSSYSIQGRVLSVKRIRGGHTFVDMETDVGIVTAGIYAQAGEFRFVLDWLLKGDVIRVFGELRKEPRTLNVEKLQIVSLMENKVREPNPICPDCGKRMESAGKDSGYRCRKCHTKAPVSYRIVPRSVVCGWYEPPTESRRHLSKPLKRMGLEQPLGMLLCCNPNNDD